MGGPDASALRTARALVRHHPLVDGHNDLPWTIRTRFGSDLARLDLAAPVPGTPERPLA